MGSPINVFGAKKTFAWSPWRTTRFAHKITYFRNPVPWDKREEYLSALSDPQGKAASAFVDTAKHDAEPEECRKKTGMARNICRVKSIGDRLRGKNYGGTSYEERLQERRESSEELSNVKKALPGS